MAPRREDRLLMRQRGAATRQVKNAGFDLVLPGQEQDSHEPLQPRRSGRARKTPQAELAPQRSTRRTPAPEELRLQPSTTRTPDSDALLPQSSLRHPLATGAAAWKQGRVAKRSVIKIEEGADVPAATTTQDDGEGVVTKKRKLNKGKELRNDSTPPDVQVQDSQPVEPDLSAQPSSGVKRRKKRKSIGQKSMRPKTRRSEPLSQGGRQPQKRVPKSKLRLPAEPLDSQGTQMQREVRETLETSDQAARPQQRGSRRGPDAKGGRTMDAEEQVKTELGKRKRKSVVAQAKKRLKSGKADGKDIRDAQEEDNHPEPEVSSILDRNAEAVPDSTGVVTEKQNMPLIHEEPRTKPKPKRRKRRSIGQQSMFRQKGKRKSTGLDIPVRPTSKKQSEPKPATQLKNKDIGTATASRATARPRRRPQIVADEPPIDEEGEGILDSEAEASDFKKGPAHPNKKAAPLQPKATASKSSKPRPQKPKTPRQPSSRTPRPPPKNTIPITIYRPVSPVSTVSTTSTSTPTSDVFSDPLTNLPQPPPTQAILTGPSILSQMTRELLSKSTTTLTSLASANPTQRSALQCRKKTVEAYGAELEARLIQLTRAVGENEVLTRRVRESGKEERELRRAVADVEGERERIRLRKEEVLKDKEKGRLEGLLKGIERVVLRGWEMQWSGKEAVPAG
ncbi:hypothetical protein JMJ35_001198 [Cladonia borealis]|uniref:Uncharacterized protein n=1 Tax=Cladonia borealis TaxID=184061 RepID=A0AA39R841_9LECA|nr:hypothetical protein JMJ35_001198 [Cladonia borealis]